MIKDEKIDDTVYVAWGNTRLPLEMITMLQLKEARCPNIVDIRGFGMFEEESRMRFCLEACDYGRFDFLRTWYKRHG